MSDKTIKVTSINQNGLDAKEIMQTVYAALKENGYNPVSQIVGYLLSEDPTYITSHKNARALIRYVDRDELLQDMVRKYLEIE